MKRGFMAKKINLKIEPLEERIVFDAALAAVIASPSTQIIYVNASATGSVHDGNSWATAYTDLQSALTEAANSSAPDQIWLAKGTYLPSQIYSPNGVVGGASGLNDPHLKTFDIPNNVTIYGGFRSGMSSLSQANINLYPTILSGDLLGNDVSNTASPNYAASRADNVWHVVTIGNDVSQTGANVSLNGLTIQRGNAVGPTGTATFAPFVYSHDLGGGVYAAWESNVILNNDVFKDNYAVGDGGAVFSMNNNITLSNSTLLNNSAGLRGGAVEFLNTYEGATPHQGYIINSYFQNNSSSVFGGAIVGEGYFQNLASSINIKGSTFVDNRAPEGGAMVFDTLVANIDRSTFIGNVASSNGGAIATTNIVGTIVGSPNDMVTTISNSTFIGNTALGDIAAHEALNNFLGFPIGVNFSRGGGALNTYVNGHMVVNNSTFIGNIAQSGDGGAILNGGASADSVFGNPAVTGENATTIVNGSKFVGNMALDGNGGAVATLTDGILPNNPSALMLTLNNSILLGNIASGNGGGLYADSSVVTDMGNTFLLNHANKGDQVYASNSMLNGIDVDANPVAAYLKQIATNRFGLLLSDSITLA